MSQAIDLQVAEHIMGWARAGAMSNGIPLVKTQDGTVLPVPRFSSYEGSTADVINHCARNGYPVSAKWGTSGQRRAIVGDSYRSARTFPLAVCLAALDAHGVAVE